MEWLLLLRTVFCIFSFSVQGVFFETDMHVYLFEGDLFKFICKLPSKVDWRAVIVYSSRSPHRVATFYSTAVTCKLVQCWRNENGSTFYIAFHVKKRFHDNVTFTCEMEDFRQRVITVNSTTLHIQDRRERSAIPTIAFTENSFEITNDALSTRTTNSTIVFTTEKLDGEQTRTVTTGVAKNVTNIPSTYFTILTKSAMLGGGVVAVGQLVIVVAVCLVRFLIRKRKRGNKPLIKHNTAISNNSANRDTENNINRRIPVSEFEFENSESGELGQTVPSTYTYIAENRIGSDPPMESMRFQTVEPIPFMLQETSPVTVFTATQSAMYNDNLPITTDQTVVNDCLNTVFEDEGSDNLNEEITTKTFGEQRPPSQENEYANVPAAESDGWQRPRIQENEYENVQAFDSDDYLISRSKLNIELRDSI